MRKPSSSCERTSITEGTSRKSSESSSKEKTGYNNSDVIKVREDVYLLHDKAVSKNLLSNSIAAKLRRHVPAELVNRSDVMNKLRRENIKDYLHLTNLNKKYSSEMQRETSKLSTEGSQILKRQFNLRKHSLLSQRKREKMSSQCENRKNANGPALPVIKFTTTEIPVKKHKQERSPSIAKPIKVDEKNIPTASYPRVRVDKEDATFVKVFKHQGIFQPHNKYSGKRESKRSEAGILKRTSHTPEYEILTLTLNDLDSASEGSTSNVASPRETKKKGRRVTWSGIDRDKAERVVEESQSLGARDFSSPADSRLEGFSTPNSMKSTKSDSFLYKNIQYRNGKSKIETIGINWAIPTDAKKVHSASLSRMHSRQTGHLSKNLHPCATAMAKEGLSVSRTKWGVPRMNSLDSNETYKLWLEKLERLKAPSEDNRWATIRDPFVSSSGPMMFEQPNISLLSNSQI